MMSPASAGGSSFQTSGVASQRRAQPVLATASPLGWLAPGLLQQSDTFDRMKLMRTRFNAAALGMLAFVGCFSPPDGNPDELELDPDLKGDVPKRARFSGEIESGGRAGAFEIGPREYHAFFFAARAGAQFDAEVLRSGTSVDFDTTLAIYGPRTEDMKFGRSVARDDDSGFGRLSKISKFVSERDGLYAAVVAGRATHDREGFFLSLTCTSDTSCTPDDYVDLRSIGKTHELSNAIASRCPTDDACLFDATTALIYGQPTLDERLAAWAEDRWEIGRGYQEFRPLPGELSPAQIEAVAHMLGLSGADLRTAIGATDTTKAHAIAAMRSDVELKLFVFETPSGDHSKMVVVTMPAENP